LQQLLGGSLPPATDQPRAVIDELKSNVPQDLAMLSAGLAEDQAAAGVLTRLRQALPLVASGESACAGACGECRAGGSMRRLGGHNYEFRGDR
jgi:hypothetical protein